MFGRTGAHAAILLRLQMALEARGRRNFAYVVSLLNLRTTGAEFLVGCRVGPGLVIRHPQGIVVGNRAVIGRDCTILHHVTLGERFGDGTDLEHACPTLGSRVVVGAGAVILGAVRVGDDATIGANAVVLNDVEPGDMVVGNPGRSLRKMARTPDPASP